MALTAFPWGWPIMSEQWVSPVMWHVWGRAESLTVTCELLGVYTQVLQLHTVLTKKKKRRKRFCVLVLKSPLLMGELKLKICCYGLRCMINPSPAKSICWSPNPACNGLGRSLEWDCPVGISSLIRGERELMFFRSWHQEKPKWGQSEKWERESYKQKESSQSTMTVMAPWSWTWSLQNCEKINFCGLTRPVVVWELLWEPKLTEISVKQLSQSAELSSQSRWISVPIYPWGLRSQALGNGLNIFIGCSSLFILWTVY